MSIQSENFSGLTVVAIQSARKLADTLRSNRQTIEAWAIVLEDLLQAITNNTLGLLNLRLLVIYCTATCKCLQACTKPTDQDTVTFENKLAAYTFIVQTALALAKDLPTDIHNVLETKDGLESHLRQMENRIWDESESQQRIMQRDTLEGELAYFEQASKLLSPSIKGHDPQKMKDAAKAAAYGAMESYLLHLRKEYQMIDRELFEQSRLSEEKNCVIDCLDVCRKALDGSNGLEYNDLPGDLTNAANGLVRVLCSMSPIYTGILSLLDARSVIRLSKTCTSLSQIPTQEWRAEKVLDWFVRDSAVLQAGMRATRSVAGGNCLREFFGRSRGSGPMELFILVDTLEGFTAMTQVFLDERYKQEVTHDLDGNTFSRERVLTSANEPRQRIVTIVQCYGSNDIHAVLKASTTREALVLTSDMVVCMYPLLELVHHVHFDFSMSFSDTLDVEIPVESAMAKELVPERWLGDRRCFGILMEGGAKSESKWRLKICNGTNRQYVAQLGFLSSSWKSLPSTISTLENFTVG